MTGDRPERVASTATNWDRFTSREVVVKFHCTWDTDHDVIEDLGPSPF